MSVADTDFLEVMRDGIAYKATKGQLDAALKDLMLTKSLRFRGDTRETNKAYMARTPTVEGNRKTWTFSAWIKRGQLSTNQTFFDAYGPANELYHLLRFNTANQLTHTIHNVGTLTTSGKITQYDRWKHVVFAYDSTQAVEADRVKIYINNVKQTLTGTYPPLNHEGNVNSLQQHNIGRYINGANQCYDGLLTAVTFVDGKALPASSFGRISKDGQNRWNPKKYSAVGPNGFYLTFEDITSTATLGKDSSSNGNDLTTSGFGLTLYSDKYDSLYDVPTPTNERSANYAILSQTDGWFKGPSTKLQGNVTGCNMTLKCYSDYVDNLGNTSSFWVTSRATGSMKTSGKYYWEIVNARSGSSNATSVGPLVPGCMGQTAVLTDNHPTAPDHNYIGYNPGGFGYEFSRHRWKHDRYYVSATEPGSYLDWKFEHPNFTVLGLGYDAATRKIYMYNNKGTSWQAMPMTGWYANSAGGGTPPMPTSMHIACCASSSKGYGSSYNVLNFGQMPFKLPIPAGFKPLNSFNNTSLRI
jgi:hypothetical protein